MIGLLIVAQLAVTIRAPDSVVVGTPAVVVVGATAPGLDLPRISAPQGDAFRLTLVGAASRVSVSGSTRETTIEQQFQIVARRVGTFTLPPFEVSWHGRAARSNSRRIVARAGGGGAAAGVPLVIARAKLGDEEGVALRAVATPDTVYVGEQVTYQVGVFLDDDVRMRLRRNPEFIPPETRGMLAYELPAPPPRTAYGKGGARYEAHVFQRGLFALDAGRYVVPQAQLVYALPLSSSFFSREESRTARADSVVVVAVEPPAAGRPEDYRGAVGDLAAELRVDSANAREGDPLVVTVSVSGRANVKLLPRPALAVPWGTVVPGDERVRVDTASVAVRGVKEFDWIVTPRRAGTLSLPAVRYPFFNPYTDRYEIAVTPPRALDVAPGSLASLDTTTTVRADSAPLLPLRPTLHAPVGPPIERHPAFWAVALLVPLPAAAAAVGHRPRRSPRPVAPADALRALGGARGTSDAARVRRAYVGALADRLALPPGALASSSGALAQALARAGVTTDGAREAEALLATLDGAAYARGERAPSGVARAAAAAYERVDREALPRLAIAARAAARLATRAPGARLWCVALLLAGSATLAGAGALRASADDATADASPERVFAAGVAQYRARHFADAARLFDAIGEREPRAADAWANFGTASWAAHDTAAAAVGWQRAMRLEPMAGDVRDRLALVGAAADGRIASVPRLPRSAAPLTALAVWVFGWGLVLAGASRRGRGSAATAGAFVRSGAALAVVAVGVGLVARDLTSRFEARGLAVVVDRGPLRTLPALAADAGPVLYPGDVARVAKREGAWARVEVGADRDGWVEWSRLEPLALGSAR